MEYSWCLALSLTEVAGIMDLVTVSFTDISSTSLSMDKSSCAPSCSHLFISERKQTVFSLDHPKVRTNWRRRRKNSSNKESFDRLVFLSVSSKIFQQENVINCNKRKTELEKPRRFLHQWSVACFLFSPLHIPSRKTPRVEEEKFFQVNKLRDEQLKDLFRSIFVLL